MPKTLITRLLCVMFLLWCGTAYAQHFKTTEDIYTESGVAMPTYDQNGNIINQNTDGWGRDTTGLGSNKFVPIGVKQWAIDPYLGTMLESKGNNDTIPHQFQQWCLTDGYNGEYTPLGNGGSPRLSRIFMHRRDASQFMFLDPLDYFIGGLNNLRFTNTLSPITNLAYHKAGSSTSGQDRVRTYFASNINKRAGFGFNLDYLYARGYYNQQQNAMFGSSLFGYYLGDKYNMHAMIGANHAKMGENGGIENDEYILNPQSFQQSYRSNDIPVNLDRTWNRTDNQTYYLTHRFNAGFYREIEVPDSLKPVPPTDGELLLQLTDSIRELVKNDSLMRRHLADSLLVVWQESQIPPTEFIPVTSFIHTFQMDRMKHWYYGERIPENYFTNLYYGNLAFIRDKYKAMSVRNTFAIALREGFNKWAQMGITLFATHEYRQFDMKDLSDTVYYHRYRENNVSVGGEIARTMGTLIHYNVNGDITVLGEDVGQFKVDGKMEFQFPFTRRDSMLLEVHGFVKNLHPGFYMRHYHNQFAWWDNDLRNEFKTRVEGTISIPRTKTSLTAGVENIKNYSYFAMRNTLLGEDPLSIIPRDYSHSVAVAQNTGSIQILSASLKQDFKLGPLHWDSEVTYQNSTNAVALPLPKINVYTNLYLNFKIAKVLNVELGGDMRYFTNYYAPDYSSLVGQWATQDASNPRVKIGNYPIINAYANLHLKRCRIYCLVTHVNAGNGRMFYAPHYPIDPMTIRFGVSWNFFN